MEETRYGHGPLLNKGLMMKEGDLTVGPGQFSLFYNKYIFHHHNFVFLQERAGIRLSGSVNFMPTSSIFLLSVQVKHSKSFFSKLEKCDMVHFYFVSTK